MKALTYKKSGVDIEKADRFLKKIKPWLKKGQRERFAGLFKFPKDKYRKPLLVASSDGVGTKLKIATLVNKHDTVGIDLVAMNVNDILTFGARPLFFLDYISTGKLAPDTLVEVVKGIAEGCRQADCALIGGETAEMPGMYKKGDYDLAGFCVGVVDEGKIIKGSKIKAQDLIIGIESNGLHSNGFSLVRRVFSKSQLNRLSRELLKPTRIYVNSILKLLDKVKIKGIAHITGGSFYSKIPPILPKGVSVKLFKDTWCVHKIFRLIQEKGNIKEKEMFKTFNMGIGMILVVDRKDVKKTRNNLAKSGLNCWVIGEVIKGKRELKII